MNSPSLNSSQESNSNTPKNKKRKGSDSTPKKRKRSQSESSGDENWVRPDKCNTCKQIFQTIHFNGINTISKDILTVIKLKLTAHLLSIVLK